MEIRFANGEDIPGLLELLAQVGQVHHEIRPDIFPAGTLKYDAAALTDLLRESNKPVLVAVTDQVVGYCFCQIRQFEAGAASVCRRELYIDDLCIREGHRGQGIAKALFAAARNLGQEQGCQTLNLNVWCGNDSAMGFYEAMGLRPRNIMMEQELC
jgi:ribosomal protein S18 acetylase RimI-like enzyme